jgi:hypothetical protein
MMPDQILVRPEIPMSEEACAFCARAGIRDYLEKAIELARQHFSVIGDPSTDLEQDEEDGEQYLVVSIRVEGDETDCSASHKAYLSAWANAGDWPQVHLIRLIYQATG